MSTNGNAIRAAAGVIVMLGLAWADRACGFVGGTGEPNDPYQIATVADLLSIGSNRDLLTRHFVLINDIDFDPNLPGGRVFDDALIARDEYATVSGHAGEAFTGVLDGQGHTIRNLSVSGRPGYDTGLFGKFDGLLQDLHLRDVRISGSPCGAIAGLNLTRGVILRCSVTGQVSGFEDTGGMVGTNWDGALIDCLAEVEVTGVKSAGGMVGGGPGATLIRCESQGDVAGESLIGGLVGELGRGQVVDSRAGGVVTGKNNVGGLVGSMAVAASILRSAADCSVTGELTAGGLVGNAPVLGGNGQLISDCRARGMVAGSVAGGLIGAASGIRIVNSYAACEVLPTAGTTPVVLGGLLGEADIKRPALAAGCFWDATLSGIPVGAGSGPALGTGLTTGQMLQATFEQAGWDFGSTWIMPDGGYPLLRWEQAKDENLDRDP